MSFLIRTVKESALWRSLFRQPYPTTSRTRALAVMNNVFLHLHPVRVKKHAVRYTYTFCLGGDQLLPVPGADGDRRVPDVLLRAVHERAYQDIQTIENSVAFGSLIRNMHRWAAHLMVLTVFLHMIRVFYHGAYKPPREFNWAIGVLLLFSHAVAELHRLPAAVGPDRLLGHHGRHPDGDLRAAAEHASRASSCWAASRSGRRR